MHGSIYAPCSVSGISPSTERLIAAGQTVVVIDLDSHSFSEKEKARLVIPSDPDYCPPLQTKSLTVRRFDTGHRLSLRNNLDLKMLTFDTLETVRVCGAQLPPSVETLIFKFCHFWQIPILHSTGTSYKTIQIRQLCRETNTIREIKRRVPLRLRELQALSSGNIPTAVQIPHSEYELEVRYI